MSQKLNVHNAQNDRLEVLVEGNAAAKSTVVLAHGFGTNKDEFGLFIDIAKTLGKNLRVVRFDFSSYGDSEGRQEDMTMEKMAGDLAAVLLAVRTTFGGTIDIIAHSLGTIVTALLAPSDITTTVFMGMPHHDSETAMMSLQERITRRGGTIDQSGISTYPRKDGAVQKLGAAFWTSYKNVDRYGLVCAFAQQTKLFIIKPLQDQIVDSSAATKWKTVLNATYSELNGNHNFVDPHDRRALLDRLQTIFSSR